MAAEESQRALLLCKPSSQAVHHVIAQEVQHAGLTVVDRLFHISPEQAMSLVLQYPAVKSRVAEHTAVKPHNTNTGANTATTCNDEEGSEKTADLPAFILAAQRHRQRLRRPPASPTSNAASSLIRHTQPPDHRLLTSIQQLAQGSNIHASIANTTTPASVPAALPRRLSTSRPAAAAASAAEQQRVHERSAQSIPLSHTTAANSGGNNNTANGRAGSASRLGAARGGKTAALAYRHSQMSFPSADADAPVTALDTLLDHPALSDSCVRHHVEHLVQDGTVLVLLVRGVDAADKLTALCGPESVAEARRTAPESWTARFGQDDVHNAVYTPHTAADAQAALSSLFPVSSSGSSDRAWRAGGAAKTHTNAHTAPAALPTLPVVDNGGGGATLPTLTFAAVLPALRAQVGATQRLSYYTGTAGVNSPSTRSALDASHVPTPLSASVGRGEAYGDGGSAPVPPTPTAAMTHSVTAQCSLAAPFPERRERLDELTHLLSRRVVG